MTVKVDSPACGCCKKQCAPKGPSPDALINEALGELRGKLSELGGALRIAFARNARLGASRSMNLDGQLSYKPTIVEPAPPGKASIINISEAN